MLEELESIHYKNDFIFDQKVYESMHYIKNWKDRCSIYRRLT